MLRFIFILMLFYLNTAYSEQVKVGTINGEIGCTNEGEAALFFNDMEVYIKEGANTFSGVSSGQDYNGDPIYFSIDGSYDSNLEISSEINMFNTSSYQENDKFRTDSFAGSFSDEGILDAKADNLYIENGGCDLSVKLMFFPIEKPEVENKKLSPEVYINTNSQNIFKNETLQVFFNTFVLAGMSEQYNVYLSINSDGVTLYDNGVDLVTDKQPLFKNILVPELSTWFEYKKLRYSFPKGTPKTDYILGLHLVDNENNVIFEDFSSVNYLPEPSPFISSVKSKQKSRGRVIFPAIRQAKSSNKGCHLGGIRTDVKNTIATELDKVTKRSMLALQMGSSFILKGRLKTLYKGAKGSYNLLKKGQEVCENMNDFETLFDNYDNNISNDNNRLSNEQASNIFAIEMLTSALSLTRAGGVLYSGFDSNDLVNGVKDYYNHQNKQFSTISSLNNFARIKIKFDQPFGWGFASKAIKLKVTATPVFTYADDNQGIALKNIPKNFTDLNNIKEKSIYLGEADSNRTSFGNINYILYAELTRGLYLIKASTENGDEVFRDTIHVTQEGQEHTMVIDR